MPRTGRNRKCKNVTLVWPQLLLKHYVIHTLVRAMTNRRTVAILRCLRSLTCYRRKMVGYAGSPKRTVYVGVTLTRSKVKVNLSGLLNFRQLAKLCMLAAMTASPLRRLLVKFPPRKAITTVQTYRCLSIFHEIQMAVFPQCVMLQSRAWAR